MNEGPCGSSSLLVFGVVSVLEFCPHFAAKETEVPRGNGLAQKVTDCPPAPPFSYKHSSYNAQPDVCSSAKEPSSSVVCALPSRLGGGSHLQGEAALVSHLHKQPCRGDVTCASSPAEVIREQRGFVSLSLCGRLGVVAGVGNEFES